MIPEDYSQILKEIRADRDAAMRKYYGQLRGYFRNWAKKNFPYLSEEDVIDAYQESLTIFFEKLIAGAFIEQKASVKTYLVGIGEKIIKKRLSKNARVTLLEEMDAKTIDFTDGEEWDESYVQRLRKAFSLLGEQCQEILKLFYYEGLDIEEITTFKHYDNKNVTTATKSRCLNTLRNLIRKGE